ncbi:SagG family ABC transporter permease subunit [Haloimpatiens sp. FM7330]|uniref:SagG family ABC transporter permease subunit n=1 Tax=Haloimpatiens sp. FM7330 TaxID=3298610 RepID=UPI0036454F9E
MSIFNIFKKEIIQNLRDKKSMFMMTIFPILMIIILGTAFSGSFASSNNIPKVEVIYSINKKAKVSKEFQSFIDEIQKTMNIRFQKINNKNEALNYISNGKYDTYINVSSDTKIKIYSNNLRVFNGSLVKTLMDTFVEKVNMMEQIAEVNPQMISKINNNSSPKFIKSKSILGKLEPRSIDFYSVTMFTMIILYSTATGSMSILSELRRKTLSRMLCSSTSKFKILIGKLLGCFCITGFQCSLVFLFSKYILKARWGTNNLMILAISASLIFMAVSVGIGLSSLIKNANILSVAINTVIPIFVFLGGGYISLEVFNSNVLNTISNISPIKWTNEAIFKMIYGNDFSFVSTAIIINLVVAFIFLLAPIVTLRKDVA